METNSRPDENLEWAVITYCKLMMSFSGMLLNTGFSTSKNKVGNKITYR